MPNLTVSANVDSLMQSANFAAFKVLLSLGNVDNTADASKPVSTATQTALDAKPTLGETSSTAYRGDRGKTAYDFSQAATTVGAAFVALTNPGAITFLRVNADNSVTALSASAFRTAIGAGAAFDPASPGAIGGTTPSTVAATALNLPTGAQLTADAYNFILGSSRGVRFGNCVLYELSNAIVLSDAFGAGVFLGGDPSNSVKVAHFAGGVMAVTASDGTGGALQLKSPDGTAYNITVANGGAVTSTAA